MSVIRQGAPKAAIRLSRHPTVVAKWCRRYLAETLPDLVRMSRGVTLDADGKETPLPVSPATRLETAKFLADLGRVRDADPRAMSRAELETRLTEQVQAITEWAEQAEVRESDVTALMSRLGVVWRE